MEFFVLTLYIQVEVTPLHAYAGTEGRWRHSSKHLQPWH
jgi:hypothetical protein